LYHFKILHFKAIFCGAAKIREKYWRIGIGIGISIGIGIREWVCILDVYLDDLVDTADVLPGSVGEADVLNLPPSRYI
jgi:hypothetical protein